MKISLLCAAAVFIASSAGATVFPAEKLLPDDTMIMATIPDFNKAREIYRSSPQGKFWNDPAMKDFREKFLSKLNADYIDPLEHDLGVHLDDYTNLPQGQLTVALVQNGWMGKDGQFPGFLVLLETKDKSAQLKTNLADLKKKWVDSGRTVKTETIREVDFSVVTFTTNDIPQTLKKSDAPLPPGVPPPLENPELAKAPKKPLYIGQAESLLIIGNSPKVIEKILARMSGGSVNTLTDIASFQANTGMFHDAAAYGWVNVKAFVDIWNHPSDESADADNVSPLGIKPGAIINALGLNHVNALAFNYAYADDGAQFNVTLAVPDANRTGLLKVLAGEGKDAAPPAFVPADTVKFQRWRLDGQKSWTALRKALSEISPAAGGVIEFALSTAEAAAKEKDPNYDINKNLFGNLGDDFIVYSKNPKGKSLAELNSPPSIFLIGSPNPEQLASALKGLLDLLGQQTGAPTDREFLGHKIYTIPLPGRPAPDGSAGPATRSLNYVSSGGYIAISMDAGLLEEYLRSSETQGKPLRDAPGLNDAMQKVGGSATSLFGYSNEQESMRVLFDALKQDPNANPLSDAAPVASAMGINATKMSDWFDASLLPDFDKMAKYFYISVYSFGATPDGLTFKAFAPTPPEFKK